MTKNVYEIFEEIEECENDDERMYVLSQYRTDFAVRSVLQGMFDPNIKFVIEQVPYYKPSDAPPGLGYSNLYQELKRAYLFVKDHPKVDPKLSLARKEQLLLQILESLESKEATVFINMLLKKPRIKGLTYDIVKKAIPDLLP